MIWTYIIAGLTVGVLIVTIFIRCHTEGEYTLCHIVVNASYDESTLTHATHHKYDYNNDIAKLRCFNEDILDQIYLYFDISAEDEEVYADKNIFVELAKTYTHAFYDALVRNQFIGVDIIRYNDIERHVLDKMIQTSSYDSPISINDDSRDFDEKLSKGMLELEKIIWSTYVEILRNHPEIATKIIAYKLRDMLLRFKEHKVPVRHKKVGLYFENIDIRLSNGRKGDRITKTKSAGHCTDSISSHKHYCIDITSIFTDVMGEFHSELIDYTKALDEFQDSFIDKSKRVIHNVIAAKKLKSTSTTQKFTIIFDQYSVVEYIKLGFEENISKLKPIIDMLDLFLSKLRAEVQSIHSTTTNNVGIEFLEREDLLKLKLNGHEAAKFFIEKYYACITLLPEVQTDNDQYPDTYCEKFGSKRCSFIDDLVEKFLRNRTDITNLLASYYEEIEEINKACSSSGGTDHHDSICVALKELYGCVYTHLVSYWALLEPTMEYKHFESIDELRAFDKDCKKASACKKSIKNTPSGSSTIKCSGSTFKTEEQGSLVVVRRSTRLQKSKDLKLLNMSDRKVRKPKNDATKS